MVLTAQQLSTLKAAILGDPTMAAFSNSSDGNLDLANYLNQATAPSFFVWKTGVSIDEIMVNGFDWTRVDNLTVGKARIWEWMTSVGRINPSQANVRAGIEACFTVEVADAPNRQAVYDHSQRPASRVEKLFAVGNGATTTAHGVGPATMAVEGPITAQNVADSRTAA